MTSQPGFFSFRWKPVPPVEHAEDIAVVFKVPGAIDLSVLPDLIENVCVGPVVPSAVVLLQLKDDGLLEALNAPPVKHALTRFNGRMPLLVFTINPAPYSLSLVMSRQASKSLERELARLFNVYPNWVRAGLEAVFDPKVVVVTAPSGYAFLKPSNDRSTYFIRAELALSRSAAVSFVAFSIFLRLIESYGMIPQKLRLLLVDTMNVAAIAFALREMLSSVGVRALPQVESFHSYGGINNVSNPLPDTSLCIVSASSSMNLHRMWIREKALSARDIITLVTFEDVQDSNHALFGLPREARPEESPPSSTYDIRITGEYFFPVMEPSRKVLLTTTHHACTDYTKDFQLLLERRLFSTFRSTAMSSTRRSLYIDANALLNTPEFQDWVNIKIPQFLKARTGLIIFQNDRESSILAQHIAYIATKLGCTNVEVRNASDITETTINKNDPIVCVAAVVGRGNALLSLSRDLRNCHAGARLYVIGMQVTESLTYLKNFDRNLEHSSNKSPIEVLRKNVFLSSEAVTESFQQELALYQTSIAFNERKETLLRGPKSSEIFLPSGAQLNDALVLNVDFAFWKGEYNPSSYHAEVLGTISAILQNARTTKLKASEQQLRSPLLMHVALDPENFARFNEGIIQAALLRAALPSELDYRGDIEASAYMVTFLKRIASKFDEPQIATLEFLAAIATKRLQLNHEDTELISSVFLKAVKNRTSPMSQAVRFFLDKFPSTLLSRQAF